MAIFGEEEPCEIDFWETNRNRYGRHAPRGIHDTARYGEMRPSRSRGQRVGYADCRKDVETTPCTVALPVATPHYAI